MSDALQKAEAAVARAEHNSDVLAVAMAALEVAKAAQAQQSVAAPSCQHQQRPGRSAGEWVGIGAAVCVGGVGIAFASIAIAIGAVSVAILALVLRSMWRDFQQKGRR
jgi:hypothetical protein